MKEPSMLEFTKDLAVAVADFYEYSMAYANMQEGIEGRQAVFDLVVRDMPTTKVIGTFIHNGVKYDELAKRHFLVNAGLEQAAAYFLEARGTPQLRSYLQRVQGMTDTRFLDWVETIRFQGDVYALPEGTIFFAQEPQLRVHERFEEAQVFEAILCNTINPQTNVATTANDIAAVTNKLLIGGGARRAGSPQGALFNSRAAQIGGFGTSSNVAHGMRLEERVGGTHGHSYVMLHPDEYTAFKAQAGVHGRNVCFLLDTYNVRNALDTALTVANEERLGHFAFRIDSGDLLEQAKWIHREMAARGWRRTDYTLIASDDLTAGKIARLEREGADIDRYLVGTYVANPPKPLGGVYKLAAFQENGRWVFRGKLAEDPVKATLPGIKQVYRVAGQDGFYKRDIIAFEEEDITRYLEPGDTAEGLLVPIIRQGRQVYDFPAIAQITQYRRQQLARFNDIEHYEVIVSNGVREAQQAILNEHGMALAAR